MRKLSLLLILALLASMCSFAVCAESEYSQSPYLDALVEDGTLPPVEERLPENPTVIDEILDEYTGDIGIGKYGGTLRMVTTNPTGYSGDMLVAISENLLVMESVNSGEIHPNLIDDYQVNDDMTVHTFVLKKGLKWSDGTEVTMEDFRFAIEDVQLNSTLNPVVPSWLTIDGEPVQFDIVDDVTFTLTFSAGYGGLATHLSCNGWKDYTYLCLPSEYLKPYHLDYAEECHGPAEAYYEFIEPFAEVLGVADVKENDQWITVFNNIKVDILNATNSNKVLLTETFEGLVTENMPVLYPWVLTSNINGVTTWVRNPYYYKVDADGNQLPYIDEIQLTYVESPEMIQMQIIAGEVDFCREAAMINNISMYRENADSANIVTYTMAMTKNPANVLININYGLNADGTVKEDDDSRAWQEVNQYVEFREALMYSIDATEVLDSVYYGFGEIQPVFECTGDTDKANQLLDSIGMVDIDADGWRETPSGLKFSAQIWFDGASDSARVPMSELYTDYWQSIGLNIIPNNVESAYLSTSVSANEVPIAMAWPNNTMLWYYNNWETNSWSPLYNAWYNAGGLTAELDSAEYLAPDGEILEFYELMSTVTVVTPDIAVSVNNVRMMEIIRANVLQIEPLWNISQAIVLNEDIRNVATGGCVNSVNYTLEQLYFDR